MPTDEKQQTAIPPSQKPTQQPTETRQKRVKIVSACSECRRKKTRCNGEQPCRNCQKSSSPCVYPISHSDDKRNGPSRAALEAIEERLQAIEDMLKTIVQSQLYMADLDPVAVSRFLNKDSSTTTNPTNSTSPTFNRQSLYISPSPQPSPSVTSNTTPPTSGNSSTGPNLSSTPATSSPPTRELRLPSIHSLSAPATEHRDLPPLNSFQDYYYPQPSVSSSTNDPVDNQSIDRKRKR